MRRNIRPKAIFVPLLLASATVAFAPSALGACEITGVDPNSAKPGEQLTVDVHGMGFSYEGNPAIHSVDFGSGITAEITNMLPVTEEPVRQTWNVSAQVASSAMPGSRTVALLDDSGNPVCLAEGAFAIESEGDGQENQPPKARIEVTPETGTVDEPVQFDGTRSVDPDGEIVRYRWNFGDGETAQGPQVTHTYPEQGTYPATLIVVDNRGQRNRNNLAVTISPMGSCKVTDVTPSRAKPGESAVFVLSGSDLDQINGVRIAGFPAEVMDAGPNTVTIKVDIPEDASPGPKLGTLFGKGGICDFNINVTDPKAAKPDLVVENGLETTAPASGQKVKLRVQITNQGKAPAGPPIEVDEHIDGVRAIPELGPQPGNKNCRLESSHPPGADLTIFRGSLGKVFHHIEWNDHTLDPGQTATAVLVCWAENDASAIKKEGEVDPNDEVGESDEGNNTDETTFSLDEDAASDLDRFDANGNCRIDESEFFDIIDKWANGEVKNDVFFEAVDAWVEGTNVCRSELSEQSLATPAVDVVRLDSKRALTFRAIGQGIHSFQVAVYTSSGERVFARQTTDSTLQWNLTTGQGTPVANGIYLYRVTARGPNGQIQRSKIRKLALMR